jgi:hypothetical protein
MLPGRRIRAAAGADSRSSTWLRVRATFRCVGRRVILRRVLRGHRGCRGVRGRCFSGEEGSQFPDGAHQRGREDDGGVLVDADLDQALQVAQLQC